MAAERPTLTGRSRFGALCASAVALLCLAHAIAGCLNPLTDDQPSAAPVPVLGGSGEPGAGAPAGSQSEPGDFLVEDEPDGEDSAVGNPGANAPEGPPATSSPDAGTELDAGPDSGSVETSP
jgi:hypothetical protein